MSNLPHTDLGPVPDVDPLESIETIDLVAPPAANRQPNTLAGNLGTVIERVDFLTANSDDLTGGATDGGPRFLDRDGHHPALAVLNMGGFRITGLANGGPSNGGDASDAVTWAQLDGVDMPFVRLEGSTMTGTLVLGEGAGFTAVPSASGNAHMDFGNRRLRNIGAAVDNTDAVRLGQLPSVPDDWEVDPQHPTGVAGQLDSNLFTLDGWLNQTGQAVMVSYVGQDGGGDRSVSAFIRYPGQNWRLIQVAVPTGLGGACAGAFVVPKGGRLRVVTTDPQAPATPLAHPDGSYRPDMTTYAFGQRLHVREVS